MLKQLDVTKISALTVTMDGTYFTLGVVKTDGGEALIKFPIEVLQSLIMSLPNLATRALRLKHNDSSLRIAYPADEMVMEKASVDGIIILTLSTLDGFKVSFSLTRPQCYWLSSELKEVQTETLRH